MFCLSIKYEFDTNAIFPRIWMRIIDGFKIRIRFAKFWTALKTCHIDMQSHSIFFKTFYEKGGKAISLLVFVIFGLSLLFIQNQTLVYTINVGPLRIKITLKGYMLNRQRKVRRLNCFKITFSTRLITNVLSVARVAVSAPFSCCNEINKKADP